MRRGAAVLLLLGALSVPVSVEGQDQAAQLVEVMLNQSVSLPLVAVSHTVVIDESICRLEIDAGILRVSGLKRGETVVVVWRNAQPESLIVRVVSPPAPPVDVQPTPEEFDAMGHGTAGALAHMSTTSRGTRHLSMLTPFAWTQGTSSERFTMNGQVQSTRSTGTSDLMLDTLSAQWTKGARTITVLDFVTNLDGGAPARITPSTRVGAFAMRGADVAVTNGNSSYELFGGATVPWFGGSRQLAGLNVTRQATARKFIDATTAVVSVRVLSDSAVVARRSNIFQTVGVTERLNDRTAVQVRGGVGTSGVFGQAASSWQGERVSAFATAIGSSPQFGLNQLQLVYAPKLDVQTGANLTVTRRLRTGFAYMHTATEATPLSPADSQSDYVSGLVSVGLTEDHTVFANGVWNRNLGALGNTGQQLTGRRVDTGLSSQFGRKIANSFQFSVGALADPLQLASRSQFTIRENASIVTGHGSLSVSFSHDRLSPSLVARLRDQLNLLAPSLQPLFTDNPVAFVESPQMPAEVRQLLASLEPVDTQVVISSQFRLGARLALSPTVSYLRHAQSSSLKTNNVMAGYALTWRATPTLEIISSLSNALVFDPRQRDLARTTMFGIGLRKTLNGAPRWIVPAAGYSIHGRVFRDLNLDGVATQQEPGLAGVTIRLSGQRTVTTNDQGRFEFNGLSAGEYRVLMMIDQLGRGVRVTTPIDPSLRLYERRVVEVDFGVVNFSRLMLAVFNDSALDGVRQADAPGVRNIGVVIQGNGADRRIVTDAAGEFQVDDLVPGQYRIWVDGETIPANYDLRGVPVDVTLAPSATVTVNLPVRALRSIEGHVYLRTLPTSKQSGEIGSSALVPLQGVTVTAHDAVAITDEQGRFVLRNLPVGELVVSVVPVKSLPADLRSPTGRLRMPFDPIQVENATIVIDNPRLVEYLIDGQGARRSLEQIESLAGDRSGHVF